MRALVWHGKEDVRVDTVPDPSIADPSDIIVEITSTAICGSDLHLYDGYQPTMEAGDILGHEPMGVVVEVGSRVKKLKRGDRVVVPFVLACGHCFFCSKQLYSSCDTSNPNAAMAAKVMGQSPAGLLGFSHMLGGFPGGQAQLLRVPYADVGPLKVPDEIPDEQALFLSDIFPTGYMAAENCAIESGDTVAVWGAGPVGQFAILSAWLLGAARVIAIDRIPARLSMAQTHGRAEIINAADDKVYDRLMEMTAGRGPDRCIDAVGCEAHSTGSFDAVLDAGKAAVGLATDRAHVIREAIMCCRKNGTISIPGVYVGFVDKYPLGVAMNKGLTIRAGQTHVQHYTRPLMAMIADGRIDPSFVITHTLSLEDAPAAYKMFRDKTDNCIKVVLKPNSAVAPTSHKL